MGPASLFIIIPPPNTKFFCGCTDNTPDSFVTLPVQFYHSLALNTPFFLPPVSFFSFYVTDYFPLLCMHTANRLQMLSAIDYDKKGRHVPIGLICMI